MTDHVYHFRHYPEGRRAVAGQHDERAGEAPGRKAARGPRRRYHRGGFSYRLGRGLRIGQADRRGREEQPGSGPCQGELRRHRPGLGGGQARGEPPDPHVHLHLRHPPEVPDPKDPRRGAQDRRGIGQKGEEAYTANVEFSAMDATRSDWDYLCKRPGRCHRRRGDHDKRPGHGRLRGPGRIRRPDPLYHGARAQISRRPSSASTATTTWGSPWPIRSRASSAGARQVECTINGIGERSGNAALEEIVMILRTRKDLFSLDTRIVSEKIYPTSRLITSVTGAPVQPNKADRGGQRLRP